MKIIIVIIGWMIDNLRQAKLMYKLEYAKYVLRICGWIISFIPYIWCNDVKAET